LARPWRHSVQLTLAIVWPRVHGVVDQLENAFVPRVTVKQTAKETALGEVVLKRIAQAGNEQTLIL
jgi:hypothetical protein